MVGAGNLIYIDNGSPSSSPLTAWSVNSQTGALTQVFSGSEIVSSVDPTFTYAYGRTPGAPENPYISGYTINRTNGSLTQLSNSPYILPIEIDDGVVSSDGKWYCGGTFNGPGVAEKIICYPRNPTTGAVGTNDISDTNFSWSTPIAVRSFVAYVFASSSGAGIDIVEPATAGIKSIVPLPYARAVR